MPYKRKRSRYWWVSYTDASGQRVRRSTGTTDRKEAEALEAKWKLSTYKEKQWNEQPDRTFDELMLAYLTATKDEKRSSDKDRQRTKNLRSYFRGRTLNGLTRSDMQAYVHLRKSQGVSNATINREFALLSAAINHAKGEWGWCLPPLPMGKNRKLKEAEGRVRWISQEEAATLLSAAQQERKAAHLPEFIRLALNTGCRSGELLGLEWDRVDLKNNLVHLEGRHTKSQKRRSVPINESARRALLNRARFKAQHCPASPWVFCREDGSQIVSVRRSFHTACRKAGIKDFRIHDMRHTFAAWLVSDGVPLTEVRDLLGHSTVKVTERYAHLAPENLRKAVARLDNVSQFGHIVGLEGNVTSATKVGTV